MLEPSDRVRPLQVSTRNLAPLAALSEKIGPGHDDILDALKYATRPDADGVIGLADYCRLLRALSVVAGEETFDLSSRPMMAGTAEIVFSRAAQAETLGEALREIAHGYNVLHGDHYNRVELRGRKIVYIIDDEHFPYTRPRDDFLNLSLECALIFVHSAICELADEDLTYCARRVWTRRSVGVGSCTAALAFWDAPISHGEPVYAVAYDAAIAARPLSRRPRQVRLDQAAHERLLSLIEARQAGGSPEDAVTGAVLRALRDGVHDQSMIAARLGVSTATLRRKLTAAGANFRALHQSVMKQAACLRLVETGDVGETAETLGFSDPRSFTRAFKAWTGETPSGFMGRRRAGAA